MNDEPDVGPDAARRMNDLAAYTDQVVHDMRNYLNVIHSNAYLLRQRLTNLDDRSARNLDRINQQVDAALRYLGDMQGFYRLQRPELQRLDLAQIAAATAAAADLPELQRVEVETKGAPFAIDGDPVLLTAALRALLRNAADAQPEGGTISVDLEREDRTAFVRVRDSGSGFSNGVLSRATTPFFTTRSSHAGLGLSLVNEVARVHGGRLELENRRTGGAEARLYIPLA